MQRFKIPNDHTVNYCSVSASDFKALDPTLKVGSRLIKVKGSTEEKLEKLAEVIYEEGMKRYGPEKENSAKKQNEKRTSRRKENHPKTKNREKKKS